MIRTIARARPVQLWALPLILAILSVPANAATITENEIDNSIEEVNSNLSADSNGSADLDSTLSFIPYSEPQSVSDTPTAGAFATFFSSDDIYPQSDENRLDHPKPVETVTISPSDATITADRLNHIPREYATHRSFGQQIGAIQTELLILTAYVGAQSIPKLFKETQSFRFKDEGWFGLNTSNVGVDKLTHAMNTYLIAELLHYRLHKNTGGSQGDAVTAAVIAAGAMAINELSDAIEPNGGYSMQDIAMNIAGASFSVLRNTVPGLKEKLSFKVEVVPNKHIYSREGKKHFEQQRYMMSLKGAGFEALRNTPLRYLDAQLGYYASDFLLTDRAAGTIPKRHLFVGVGLNVGEIFFANSRSRFGRAAHSVLDYVQLPYTSLRYDTTGRIGN